MCDALAQFHDAFGIFFVRKHDEVGLGKLGFKQLGRAQVLGPDPIDRDAGAPYLDTRIDRALQLFGFDVHRACYNIAVRCLDDSDRAHVETERRRLCQCGEQLQGLGPPEASGLLNLGVRTLATRAQGKGGKCDDSDDMTQVHGTVVLPGPLTIMLSRENQPSTRRQIRDRKQARLRCSTVGALCADQAYSGASSRETRRWVMWQSVSASATTPKMCNSSVASSGSPGRTVPRIRAVDSSSPPNFVS